MSQPDNSASNVLVVEDDPTNMELLTGMLESSNGDPMRLKVRQASCLSKGLEELRRKPDVLLLDLNLPDSNGIETLKEVFRVVWHIPVVVITGDDNPEMMVKCLKAGAQHVLIKGEFRRDELIRTVASCIHWQGPNYKNSQHLTELRRLMGNSTEGE